MNWIIQNIGFISLVIAIINIVITIFNWYSRRPRLVFYDSGVEDCYMVSGKNERCYLNSKSVVFFYVKIANLSDMPCTISEFSLDIEGYPTIFYRTSTVVLDRYYLYHKDNVFNGVQDVTVKKEDIIPLPCTIPPLGYVEGHAVFPYGSDYDGKRLFVELTAKTARKDFKTNGFISLYTENEAQTLSSDA